MLIELSLKIHYLVRFHIHFSPVLNGVSPVEVTLNLSIDLDGITQKKTKMSCIPNVTANVSTLRFNGDIINYVRFAQ